MIAIKNKQPEVQSYSIVLWLGFAFLVLLISLVEPIAAATIMLFFGLCSGFWLRWSNEIGQSPYIPFVMVLFFGLLGHLGYYIYYRIKRKGLRKSKKN